MMKFLSQKPFWAALSLCMLLSLGAAHAQGAKPSAAQVQSARELIDASGMSRSFVAMLPQFLADAKASLTATRPEIVKDLDEVIVQLNKEFAPQVEELQQAAAGAMATRFTEAELKDLVTFFKSPVGRKYVDQQPAMMDTIFRVMTEWGQATSALLIDRIRVEMKKRGHTI